VVRVVGMVVIKAVGTVAGVVVNVVNWAGVIVGLLWLERR
jgi:hypothetical protein